MGSFFRRDEVHIDDSPSEGDKRRMPLLSSCFRKVCLSSILRWQPQLLNLSINVALLIIRNSRFLLSTRCWHWWYDNFTWSKYLITWLSVFVRHTRRLLTSYHQIAAEFLAIHWLIRSIMWSRCAQILSRTKVIFSCKTLYRCCYTNQGWVFRPYHISFFYYIRKWWKIKYSKILSYIY